MKRVVKLFFIHPTDKPINEKGGRYGAPRHGGRSHKGIDYLAPIGTDVKASESGTVVKSGNRAYSPGAAIIMEKPSSLTTPLLQEMKSGTYTRYTRTSMKGLFPQAVKLNREILSEYPEIAG